MAPKNATTQYWNRCYLKGMQRFELHIEKVLFSLCSCIVPLSAATSVCHITHTRICQPSAPRFDCIFLACKIKKRVCVSWVGRTDNYFRLRISVRWGGNISIVALTCNFSCTLVVAGGHNWGGEISCYTFIICFPILRFWSISNEMIWEKTSD